MNTVWLRGVEVGTGIPKIVVPIVGRTADEILEQAGQLAGAPSDVVEWRADLFQRLQEEGQLLNILERLRGIIKETPLLFTIRTRREGGEGELTPQQYTVFNQVAAESGFVDAVDVEVFWSQEIAEQNIQNIHRVGVKVVGSNHHFDGTPGEDELVRLLREEQELGCDILKLAVMPKSKRDVLTLLSATERMYTNYAHQPLVTMSMAATGVLSRFCGEVFGSSMTFGAVGKTSAPGQVPVQRLDAVLRMIHESIQR